MVGFIMKIEFTHSFEEIISLENLLESWKEFLKGKRKRKDVQEFSLSLMDNIVQLHQDLANHTYNHGSYQAFRINDPKPRQIHKSSVRDRLLHHAIHRMLYPFFDRTFVSDSFSCRIRKGTHKALNRFREFGHKTSRNNTCTCWILKCDIRKLFVNIYMNKFDQFVKHKLKARYYIRYADDFVIMSQDKSWLEELLPKVGDFLSEHLKLNIHPDKVLFKTLASGVDFLGWVHFPDHRLLRTSTKGRMFKRVISSNTPETKNSYLGLLKHGNTDKLKRKINSLAKILKN